MPIELDRTTKELTIDLPENVPDSVARDIRSDIGQFIVDAILDSVGSGKSPVSGYGSFSSLSKDYANSEKGGRTLPNLDLNGDMLNALTYEVNDDGVEVGIFDSSQAIKSYGHNTGFEGHPWLDGVAPQRKFIPSENEDFNRSIQGQIDRIIEERLADLEIETPDREDVNQPIDFRSSQDIIEDIDRGQRVGTFTEIATDDSIASLINRILRRTRGQS